MQDVQPIIMPGEIPVGDRLSCFLGQSGRGSTSASAGSTEIHGARPPIGLR